MIKQLKNLQQNKALKIFSKIEFFRGKSKLLIGIACSFIFCGWLGFGMIIPCLLSALVVYLKFSQEHSDLGEYSFLGLTLLFVIALSGIYFIIQNQGSLIYIPLSVIPMLSVILFNELKASLLLTIASSLIIGLISGGNFYLAILFLISGIFALVFTYGARRRSVITKCGFFTGLIQAAVYILMYGFHFFEIQKYSILIVNGIISSIIVIGTLPFFEYLFKTVTNISLLELADFNHPLLQRMTLEAPGTYHHSLIVGNLSDAACQAVGANALLARIGAYYHDIGKLSKPEYFSENQNLNLNQNKHDTLSPSMSKIVIINHIKEGVELAKQYKLNSKIIDFIEQHHGNSLVYYFYIRALENSQDEKEITQDGFRYPYQKPKTKEIAIVHLADSVEAATRTLKEPSITNISELVHKVINNKFIDGQLDECDLTLKELEKIAEVFIRILSGIYHSRINYPQSSTSESS